MSKKYQEIRRVIGIGGTCRGVSISKKSLEEMGNPRFLKIVYESGDL
jgi:hypothetical protein